MPTAHSGSTELTGTDWFLLSVERMMRAAGQGEHIGLTALDLGAGLDVAALRSAAARLAAASPVVAGRLKKTFLRLPRWQWEEDAGVEFPVHDHPQGTRWEEVAERRLAGAAEAPVGFDVIPREEGVMLLLRWRHSLLDGKGAELFLGEIARLAADPAASPQKESWGPVTVPPPGWRADLSDTRKFKDYYYPLAAQEIRSLGGACPRCGGARFHVERFSAAESAQIAQRAADVSRGLFQIGWFLAAAMRAHRRVLVARREGAASIQANCAVQERKRGAKGPIWQNHVTQMFFGLASEQLDDLDSAAELLHEQFADMSRQRLEAAFAGTARLFRRLPSWFWMWKVRRHTGGHITSFFFSHTGEFLPECTNFCGAAIEHAWHIPTVSQPPGMGIFLGQRAGRLTVTFSWREGVLRAGELETLRRQIREDLLGA